MMLTKDQVTQGALREWELFAQLVEGLDAEQWAAPSRCAGWEVRDVSGHVLGTAVDVQKGTFGQRSPEDQAEAGHDLSPAAHAAELRATAVQLAEFISVLNDDAWNGPSGVNDLTIAEGVLALWYDTWIHADDIRAAVGLPSERGEGLTAAVEHVAEVLAKRQWGPARLALRGVPETVAVGAVGVPNERVVQGDALDFVLVATGRGDPSLLGLDASVNIYAE
jgi:uncharacterized protein (TIGR03083 family)